MITRWLVGNWQLKLLSIVLTLALLGAVAFTQNPPTQATVNLHIAYPTPPSGLVLVNPPTEVQVNVVGLSNSVDAFHKEFANSTGAKVDLTAYKEGANQAATAVVTADADGVSVSPSAVPIRVDLDTMQTARLPIEVRVTNVNSSAGVSVVQSQTYATCGNDAVKCQVTVHAPASLLHGLVAYLSYLDPQPNQAGIERVPGLPIKFERDGKTVDLTGTGDPQVIPNQIQVQPDQATARVETEGGTLQTTAPVFAKTTGSVACGYAVQGMSYSPSTVTITGPTQTVTTLQSIQLASIDVSGLSSTETVTRQLNLPSGVQAVSGTSNTISVTVTVAFSYTCTPSSGGNNTPTPQPSPSSTATPTPAR